MKCFSKWSDMSCGLKNKLLKYEVLPLHSIIKQTSVYSKLPLWLHLSIRHENNGNSQPEFSVTGNKKCNIPIRKYVIPFTTSTSWNWCKNFRISSEPIRLHTLQLKMYATGFRFLRYIGTLVLNTWDLLISYAYFVFISWLMHLLANDIGPRIWTHVPNKGSKVHAQRMLSWKKFLSLYREWWSGSWPLPSQLSSHSDLPFDSIKIMGDQIHWILEPHKFVSHTQTWIGQHRCWGMCCPRPCHSSSG
jgi:hypothetical protein